MKKQMLSVLASSILTVHAYAASSLTSLEDDEMRSATGQALLYMGTTSGSDLGSDYNDFKYYKMGLQADIEANLNIKTLQLGCGGVNGAGKCDIDIENLALTGVPTHVKSDGTPQWNYSGTAGANERAASSAQLRNPFVEFAIKNPTSASLREVVGVRLSAEGIKGYMTAGTFNDTATTANGGNDATANLNKGGIHTFSGFITTAPSPVVSRTEPDVKFGLTRDQMINSSVKINAVSGLINHSITAFSNISGMATPPSGAIDGTTYTSWGVNIPQKVVAFDFPTTVVTGNRMSQLDLKVDNVPIGTIATGALDGPLNLTLSAEVAGMDQTTFFMGKKGSRSWNVRATDDPWLAAPAAGSTSGAANTRITENLTPAEKVAINNAFLAAGYAVNSSGCWASGGAVSTTECSFITGLTANVNVKQDFVRMHNLPVAKTDTTSAGCSQLNPCYDFNKGFYLSLQNQNLRWPGSTKAFYVVPNGAQTDIPSTEYASTFVMYSDGRLKATYNGSNYVPNNGEWLKKEVADSYARRDYVAHANGSFKAYYTGNNFNAANGETLRQENVQSGDIAKRGWWMSFAEPLYFGKLEPRITVPMTDVLPQVATFINDFFSQQLTDSSGEPLFADQASYSAGTKLTTALGSSVNHNFGNPCRIGGGGSTRLCNAGDISAGKIDAIPKYVVGLNTGDALGALFGAPVYVPLGNINVAGIPAVMEMSNLPLTNYQAVVPNCWGNLKFC